MIKVTTFSLLTILLLAACGGPAASPTPGGSPTPTPGGNGSPTPAPTPTSAPSPSPSPSPTPAGGLISHPTGAHEPVLQYRVEGGFVPPDVIVTQAPQFSLYGDGTVVWRPREDEGRMGVPGLPRFLQGKMSEDAMQALLGFALGPGRLAGAREHYMQNSCADCPTTIFRINADGADRTVAIDALGMEEQMDQLDRRGFLQLAETLGAFDEQARNGVAGDVAFYDPPLYLVVLTEAVAGMGDFGAWPWQDLALDAFGPRGEGGWQRQAHLTREQVAVISEVPSGGTMGILVEDPAGGLWSIALRPMLPDEVAEAQTQ